MFMFNVYLSILHLYSSLFCCIFFFFFTFLVTVVKCTTLQYLLCTGGWWWCWWWWWCKWWGERCLEPAGCEWSVTELFSLEVVLLKSTVVLPLRRASLWWGNRHSAHGPALRLYWCSPSPAGHSVVPAHVRVSVKFGHLAPPYMGVARTWRVRCCRPTLHVLLQVDHEE